MNDAYFHSDRLAMAFDYAADCHADQFRKGTDIPYLSHLMGVASNVMEAADGEAKGAELENLVIAALLHDAVEDHGGLGRLEDIELHFGARVAEVVRACSDAIPSDGEDKAPWPVRKVAYLRHIEASEDPGALLVSAADKLHNARTIITDLRMLREAGRPQTDFWQRFLQDKRGADYPARVNEILWYYASLATCFAAKAEALSSSGLSRLSLELTTTVDAIRAIAAEDGLAPQAPAAES